MANWRQTAGRYLAQHGVRRAQPPPAMLGAPPGPDTAPGGPVDPPRLCPEQCAPVTLRVRMENVHWRFTENQYCIPNNGKPSTWFENFLELRPDLPCSWKTERAFRGPDEYCELDAFSRIRCTSTGYHLVPANSWVIEFTLSSYICNDWEHEFDLIADAVPGKASPPLGSTLDGAWRYRLIPGVPAPPGPPWPFTQDPDHPGAAYYFTVSREET